MTHKTYRIEMSCPRCGKTYETIKPLIPPPHVNCGDCLMERVEIVALTVDYAEQMPDEPMVNLRIFGPNGEKIE